MLFAKISIPRFVIIKMAGREGFEPSQTLLERDVLPLHQRPTYVKN